MSIQRPRGTYFRFRAFEKLELRDMFSGHTLAAGFMHSSAKAVAAQMTDFWAVSPTVFASHNQAFGRLDSQSSTSDETTLTAKLTDANGAATGTAKFQTETDDGVTETKLTVSVTGAAASTTLGVSIGSTVVGTLATDATGAGKLVLASSPTGTEQPLPANFPASVLAGAIVNAGSLSGTLATPTPSHGDRCDSSQQTVLSTSLTDPNSSATSTVRFAVGTHDGVSQSELTVSVAGATANSPLSISIGGTVVGTLTTDSTGAGKLVLASSPTGTEQPLPANFPTSVTAGTAVSVGSLSGALAAATNPHGDDCEHSQHTNLTAALTDPNNTAITGTIAFHTGTNHGVTATTFSVNVTGAAANSTLDVSIGGTTVGSLSTDGSGAGMLVLSSNPTGTQQALPANFPTSITAGTTVTVGSLTGTLAAASHSGHAAHHFGRHR